MVIFVIGQYSPVYWRSSCKVSRICIIIVQYTGDIIVRFHGSIFYTVWYTGDIVPRKIVLFTFQHSNNKVVRFHDICRYQIIFFLFCLINLIISYAFEDMSWIYNYRCSQCLSPPKLPLTTKESFEFESSSWRGVLDKTLCDESVSVTCMWFSPVSSTNKTDCHYIIEVLLKVTLTIITTSCETVVTLTNVT